MLRVIKPGMLTTIQDAGRWGLQDRGVPVGGPMDWLSHRRANALVGNEAGAAALEITLIGPQLEFETEALFAVSGAEFDLFVNDKPAAMDAAHRVSSGVRLVFGARRRGARAYLAVAGGFDVAAVFGSRATNLTAKMGGIEGRALRAGDVLCFRPAEAGHDSCLSPDGGGQSWAEALASVNGGARLRVMAGPQDDLFARDALDVLQAEPYQVTTESNRMAYRLKGRALAHLGEPEIISDATPLGAVQVPASGQPILLMADRQTTGGYPKIATVITADLPLAGQLAPGDWIEFAICTHDEALRALKMRTW